MIPNLRPRNLPYHVGVAYAVRALESECANIERTHDEFPRSGPSPLASVRSF